MILILMQYLIRPSKQKMISRFGPSWYNFFTNFHTLFKSRSHISVKRYLACMPLGVTPQETDSVISLCQILREIYALTQSDFKLITAQNALVLIIMIIKIRQGYEKAGYMQLCTI